MPGPDFLVFIPGYGSQDLERSKFLAQALGLTMIDAKMLLAARTPRRVGVFARREDAAKLLENLKTVGLAGFVIDRQEFREKAFVVKARGIEIRDDGVNFTPIQVLGPAADVNPDQVGMVLPKGAITAMVMGVISENTFKAVVEGKWIETTHRVKGIPFLHLYWSASGGFLEIRHEEFDFGCIPAASRSMSGGENFLKVVEFLRSYYAPLPFSDQLYKQPGDTEIITAALPVDWTAGQAVTGLLSANYSATNEAVAVCAARILARSIMS